MRPIAGDAGGRRTPNSSGSRAAPRSPRRSASRFMPATASISSPPKKIAALPEMVELNIGHFLIGEAIFGGLGRRRCAGCAPPWTAAGARIGDGRDDHRHRLRHHRHAPHREGASSGTASALSIASSPTTERAQAERRPTGSRPMPSASPPRRHAPRRWARVCARGVWWRDMGVVNLPSGRPTMELTGGAQRGSQAITPAGYEAAHRPHDHRRAPWPRPSSSSRRCRRARDQAAILQGGCAHGVARAAMKIRHAARRTHKHMRLAR